MTLINGVEYFVEIVSQIEVENTNATRFPTNGNVELKAYSVEAIVRTSDGSVVGLFTGSDALV